MAYSSGGLIEASDYNNFLNGSNQFNSYWGQGTGDAGYGQTALNTVAVGNTVSATEWASLINNLNNARNHQSGSGSGISAVTAGQRIDYISTLATQINSGYTNRLSFASQGSTLTGSTDTTNFNTTATGTITYFRDTNIYFDDVDKARYFFNAGGQLNFVCSATDLNGSARSAAAAGVINSIGGMSAFRYTTNGGRTGTGNSLIQNDTSLGYYDMIYQVGQTIVRVDSSSAAYTSMYALLNYFTDDSNSTRGSKGRQIVLRLNVYVPADDVFGGSVNVNMSVRCDVVYPESTYLTNSWGTPTITFDSL